VDRHLPHDTARNARFFVGIVNAAKMEIFSAGQHLENFAAALQQDGPARPGQPLNPPPMAESVDRLAILAGPRRRYNIR
jgi:hypothetical protein